MQDHVVIGYAVLSGGRRVAGSNVTVRKADLVPDYQADFGEDWNGASEELKASLEELPDAWWELVVCSQLSDEPHVLNRLLVLRTQYHPIMEFVRKTNPETLGQTQRDETKHLVRGTVNSLVFTRLVQTIPQEIHVVPDTLRNLARTTYENHQPTPKIPQPTALAGRLRLLCHDTALDEERFREHLAAG